VLHRLSEKIEDQCPSSTQMVRWRMAWIVLTINTHYHHGKKCQKTSTAPGEEGFAALLGHEQGGDGQSGDGKGIGPPGEEKLQPEKDASCDRRRRKKNTAM
jgi:hypothetical protein